VVLTGPSGSGKSSLAFDTLYAEGQRRYVESLARTGRHFQGQLAKPDVDAIDGLSPAIAIEQKSAGANPRSTVGTITEISDFLRLLFARAGRPFCPGCGRPISSQSLSEMCEQILSLGEGQAAEIWAPVVRGRRGSYRKELEGWRRQGFVRVQIDGETFDLAKPISLTRQARHDIDVVVDRLRVGTAARGRIADSLQVALDLAGGMARIAVGDGRPPRLLSREASCPHCALSFPELSPSLFSFNSPRGACPDCEGLGVRAAAAGDEGPLAARCDGCSGTRLCAQARHVVLAERSIADLCALPVSDLRGFLESLDLPAAEQQVADVVVVEIVERLRFLEKVGLPYLSLDRPSASLSGGESQRIRLATQIGTSLHGVLYILDEPSIGLHPRDNRRLLDCLFQLRDMGNSVLVVEHDEETIRAADFVIDMGPGAGEAGGEVVACGTPEGLAAQVGSPTGDFLSGRKHIPLPKQRRGPAEREISILGCSEHNLKQVDLKVPLGRFSVVTGVSGSGKSTLISDTLQRLLAVHLHGAKETPGRYAQAFGLDLVDKVVAVDQAPIGRSPRSNPASFTGAFGPIRKLFAGVPEARVRGYGPGRFSFNVPGGRCDACDGDGFVRVEMPLLPDLFVACRSCSGRRYERETLEIRYKGRSIADVLEMSVDEGLAVFENIGMVARPLHALCEVGLGYLQLGQPAPTLSGGEAQRIKLARELARRSTGRTLYLLDEPTTGLHLCDVELLIGLLQRLVDQGNTVVVVEHHLDFVKCADFVIDLGPEAGEDGGEIVVSGTPEVVCQEPRSHTGRALRRVLEAHA